MLNTPQFTGQFTHNFSYNAVKIPKPTAPTFPHHQNANFGLWYH